MAGSVARNLAHACWRHSPLSATWQSSSPKVGHRLPTGCSAGLGDLTPRAGRKACGCWSVGNGRIPARNSPFPTPTVGGSRPSRPTLKSAARAARGPAPRPHRVEDRIHCAKNTPPGPPPIAATQRQHRLGRVRRSRLRPARLDPPTAPRQQLRRSRAQLRYRLLHVAARLIRTGDDSTSGSTATGPGATPSSPLTPGSPQCREPLPDCRFRSYEPARRRRPQRRQPRSAQYLLPS